MSTIHIDRRSMPLDRCGLRSWEDALREAFLSRFDHILFASFEFDDDHFDAKINDFRIKLSHLTDDVVREISSI